MDLIYMESRKKQNLLSKLGGCGPRVEGKGRGREGHGEKCVISIKTIKNKKLII